MKRIESFRFWINDYVTSTVRRRCSLEARGLYLDILMLLYSSHRPGYACELVGGELVYLDPSEILQDVGHAGREDLWNELTRWGALICDDLGWHNLKAVEVAENERDFRLKKANAGRKGGKARAKRLREAKQTCSTATSTASSKRVAKGVANAKPPDPDSDPDPVSDSEPDSPDWSPTEPLSLSADRKRPQPTGIDVSAVFALYSDICVPRGFVSHRSLNPTMKKQIRARIRERRPWEGDDGDARSDSIEWWRAYFQACAGSAFLCDNRNVGNLVYITGIENMDKLIAGNFWAQSRSTVSDRNAANAKEALRLLGEAE